MELGAPLRAVPAENVFARDLVVDAHRNKENKMSRVKTSFNGAQ